MSTIRKIIEHAKINKYNILGLIVCVVFISLLYQHKLSQVSAWANQDHLYLQNQTYLANVEHKAGREFIQLATLSSLLEVAQSSQIGVSFFADFNVDVGNALSSITQLAEYGAGVAVGSTVTVQVLSLLSSTAELISPWLFKLLLVLTSVFFLCRLLAGPEKLVKLIQKIMLLCFSSYLMAHIAFPYSIHLASGISQAITSETRLNNQKILNNIHFHLIENHQSDLKQNAKSSLDKLKTMSRQHINHKVDSLSRYVIYSLTLALFDLILMPGFLLLFLYLFIRVSRQHLNIHINQVAMSKIVDRDPDKFAL